MVGNFVLENIQSTNHAIYKIVLMTQLIFVKNNAMISIMTLINGLLNLNNIYTINANCIA